MSDDVFSELLKSPLDEDAERRRRRRERPRAPWLPFLLALLGGAAIALVLVVVLSGSDDGADEAAAPSTEPTAADSTPATTLPPTVPPGAAASEHGLPAGYVPVAADLGIRAEWVMGRDDQIFVGLSTTVAAGTAPVEVAGFVGGTWTLDLVDGRSIPFTREWRQPEAVGFVTVEFPATGIDLAAIEGVTVQPAVTTGEAAFTETVAVDALPYDGPGDAFVFELDPRASLVAGDLQLRDLNGGVTWRLEGGEGVRATVDASVSLPGEPEPEGILAPDHLVLAGFAQQRKSLPAPVTAGKALMLRSGEPFPQDLGEVIVTWLVTWQGYGSEAITIPLGEAVLAEV